MKKKKNSAKKQRPIIASGIKIIEASEKLVTNENGWENLQKKDKGKKTTRDRLRINKDFYQKGSQKNHVGHLYSTTRESYGHNTSGEKKAPFDQPQPVPFQKLQSQPQTLVLEKTLSPKVNVFQPKTKKEESRRIVKLNLMH